MRAKGGAACPNAKAVPAPVFTGGPVACTGHRFAHVDDTPHDLVDGMEHAGLGATINTQQEACMVKKSPPTPDINEKAPRPRHLSSDSDDIPTMDSSPPATSRIDKEIDQAEGVDPEAYKEFWAERQSFPQQDDPDQEGLWDEEEGNKSSDV